MTKRFKTIEVYPAMIGVTFAKGVKPIVFDGDVLTLKGCLNNWSLNSVIGYALKRGVDHIAAYDSAKKAGHATHWAENLGAAITNNTLKSKACRIVIAYGDIITFHDKTFRIEKANNNNIELVEVNQ